MPTVQHLRTRHWWFNRESFATTLLSLAAQAWEDEFLQWDPETIQMEAKELVGRDIPRTNFNKLMAAIRLVTSDAFYVSLPDFIDICNALYSGYFNPELFDPADAMEIAWGITESVIIWPPDETTSFNEEIIGYIAAALKAEGILKPPKILQLAKLSDDIDLWQQVNQDFADDPAMFNAIYQVEEDKVQEINDTVEARLQLLLKQLKAIGVGDEQKVLSILQLQRSP